MHYNIASNSGSPEPAAMMKWTSVSVLKTEPFSMASAQPSGCLLGSLSFVAINVLKPTLECCTPPNWYVWQMDDY